ncbi:DUF3261 domain-containing protein [Aurantivibrio infirmus]
MQAKLLAYFFTVFLVSACSSLENGQHLPELPLLPPADLGVNLQISQQVNITIESESHTMLAAWVVKQDTLSFVGLSPTGQRLLTLSYDGLRFSEDYSPMLPIKIPGRQVLAQLQIAHWPEVSVLSALEKSAWRMKVEDGQRHLFVNRKKIFSIANSSPGKYQEDAKVNIRSDVIDFSIDVTTLSVNEL